MKISHFIWEGRGHYGIVENVSGVDTITALSTDIRTVNSLSNLSIERRVSIPLSHSELLAPVQPSKIVCVGRNYREHAAELCKEVPSEPLIFLKPPSS